MTFRVKPELKRDIERIPDDEQRNLSQACEMLVYEGVETYKKEGSASTTLLVHLVRLSSTTKRSTSRASAPGAGAAVASWEGDFR